MCAALKVTRQGYYAWRSRGPSAHDLRDAELAAMVSEIHSASRGVYGAPKVFADITYVRTRQGWIYLAVVMDVWSRRMVGWSMSARMTADPADDALRMAIARRRPPAGCIHRSDHGSQHASLLLGKTMREAGIEPSMGSISSPWDNAAMESLHGRHRGRARARAHLREPRAGGARDLRVHRVLLQQGQDALGARIPQPRGVRESQPARGRPHGGGVEA